MNVIDVCVHLRGDGGIFCQDNMPVMDVVGFLLLLLYLCLGYVWKDKYNKCHYV